VLVLTARLLHAGRIQPRSCSKPGCTPLCSGKVAHAYAQREPGAREESNSICSGPRTGSCNPICKEQPAGTHLTRPEAVSRGTAAAVSDESLKSVDGRTEDAKAPHTHVKQEHSCGALQEVMSLDEAQSAEASYPLRALVRKRHHLHEGLYSYRASH
jgi:hypothetical protein